MVSCLTNSQEVHVVGDCAPAAKQTNKQKTWNKQEKHKVMKNNNTGGEWFDGSQPFTNSKQIDLLMIKILFIKTFVFR